MQASQIKKTVKGYIYSHLYRRGKSYDSVEIRSLINRAIDELENNRNMKVEISLREVLIKELEEDIIGFGPLTSLLEDEEITEIMVNGPGKIYIEKEGKKILTDLRFDDEKHLRYIIEKLLHSTHRRLDELSPYVDLSLPGGSRVNIVIPPVAPQGPVVTIRKFLKTLKSIEDLVSKGTLDENMANFLVDCVKAKVNIVFSGATGAGKTTTLNILSQYISPQERIIVIEDVLELRLHQEHVVRLESRPAGLEGKGEITIRDLFNNSLRMRPDRIILGEIRKEEALDLLQAISSGHLGSLAVVHASSPEEVLTRLELMVILSGVNIPVWALRKLLSNSLDLIVQHEQFPDGSRKITRITEVQGVGGDNTIELQDLFYFDLEKVDKDGGIKGRFRCTGIPPKVLKKFYKYGIDRGEDFFRSY